MSSSRVVISFLALTLLSSFSSFGQSQQGYVRTNGRSGKPGTPVSGVMVKAAGPYNSVMSAGDGRFTLSLDGLKNGEAYAIESVRKSGYELLDKAFLNRKLGLSTSVPVEIVLVSQSSLAAEKAAMAERFEAKVTEQYRLRVSELEAKVKAMEISLADAANERESLDNQWLALLDKIDEMTDRYARTDYDSMSEIDRLVNSAIEQGEFDEAERLIRSKGDIDTRTKEYKAERDRLKENRAVLEKAEALQSKAEASNEAAKENLASDIINLYEIAKTEFKRDTAYYYLKRLLDLDPENADYLEETGRYVSESMALYEEALEMCQKSLAIKLNVYGEEHPDVANSYISIGIVYSHLGRYEEALDMYQKSLPIYLKVYGEEHPDVASIYSNIGIALEDLGRYEESIDMYLKSQPIFMTVYGEGHPEVAGLYNNIGAVYYAIGRYEEALDMYRKSFAIRLKAYGEEHSDVADSYNNNGNMV